MTRAYDLACGEGEVKEKPCKRAPDDKHLWKYWYTDDILLSNEHPHRRCEHCGSKQCLKAENQHCNGSG